MGVKRDEVERRDFDRTPLLTAVRLATYIQAATSETVGRDRGAVPRSTAKITPFVARSVCVAAPTSVGKAALATAVMPKTTKAAAKARGKVVPKAAVTAAAKVVVPHAAAAAANKRGQPAAATGGGGGGDGGRRVRGETRRVVRPGMGAAAGVRHAGLKATAAAAASTAAGVIDHCEVALCQLTTLFVLSCWLFTPPYLRWFRRPSSARISLLGENRIHVGVTACA